MLSIIICTFNRAFILKDCLNSLVSQFSPITPYELIIIDNNSSDNTSELIKNYQKEYPFIRYIFESRQGLSYARNKGFQVAKGQWIGYIDDDAKARPNLIAQAYDIIQKNTDFDAFGGMYYPWYKFGKPYWLPVSFGQKKLLATTRQTIQKPELSGGIFFIQKKILVELDGFNPRLGMHQTIGYGEETDLQVRLIKKGYVLGFDPDLIIDHCVMPQKFKLTWHMNAAYSKGRDHTLTHKDSSIHFAILQLFKTYIGGFFKRLPIGLYKLLFLKDYFIQNLFLDLVTPIFHAHGRLRGALILVFPYD